MKMLIVKRGREEKKIAWLGVRKEQLWETWVFPAEGKKRCGGGEKSVR